MTSRTQATKSWPKRSTSEGGGGVVGREVGGGGGGAMPTPKTAIDAATKNKDRAERWKEKWRENKLVLLASNDLRSQK